MRSNLKIYKLEFIPLNNHYPHPSRKVFIVAYSEEQAKKFLRDWLVNVKRCNFFFEGIERVNKTSKEGKYALKPYTIEERFERQNKLIYGANV